MATHLTFTNSITDDVDSRHHGYSFEFDEFQSLAGALVLRLKEGSLPPDDAYWWTRTLCAEAYMREEAPALAEHCRVA